MTEHVTHAVSYEESVIHGTPPGGGVRRYLEPILECLAEDLNDIVSALTEADQAWFLSSAGEIWSCALKFEDEP